MKTHTPGSTILIRAAVVLITTTVASPSSAAGLIDASTLVTVSHGTFNGVQYARHEAMFDGLTAQKRPYRVPCQIITPVSTGEGSGLLLFDWLVPSTIVTAVGQEQADARYTMTDDFLFGTGLSYATVRCALEGIGMRSPVSDPTRPWSDGLLDTSSEFISSAGDEFDIVVDYVKALRTDPVALELLGAINRRAAFGYSASGDRVRGLLRLQMGKGLFDFSVVGGTGIGYSHPKGNGLAYSKAEKAPLPGAGLEIDLQSETDVILFDGQKTRQDESNYRVYQFAGTAHIRDIDAAEFGLADPELANPAEWTPFIRALFVAANNWCDGIQPPPTLWLGAPNDPNIARDAKGNALVTHVGGLPVNITAAYRLPEVAVGENQYIPLAPSYRDGTFLGSFRFICGGHVDLTDTFTDHADYVSQITFHARDLQANRYLLEADADSIIQQAIQSDIGRR
jgi:Alpha/beta hydrolase domain